MNTLSLVLAFSAGLGVFMVVQSLGARRPRVRLLAEDERPFLQRAVETFLSPAAARVSAISGRANVEALRADLARRLARAGYPPPFTSPEAVMGYRLFTALLFAAMGGIFGLVVGLGATALAVAAGLGALGWVTPDRVIAGAEKARVEQLILDGATTLDRLAIYVAAGNALPSAVISLAERPGGAWVAEFRRVAAAYLTGRGGSSGSFAAALEEAVERSGRLPEIARVCERLRAASEMGGGGVAETLRRMAADARTRIRLRITERGYQNAVLMVIPAFLAIIAISLVLLGPGMMRMLGVLGGW